MTSQKLGASISQVEVTNIDSHGIWVFVREKEYFLPYEDYPWFRDTKVADIINVQLLHDAHLHWPTLDVDLAVESLENPAKYPLVAE